MLIVETGQFALLWRNMIENLGLKPEVIPTDWRVGADADAVEAHLKKDGEKAIKAVCITASYSLISLPHKLEKPPGFSARFSSPSST